MKLAALSIYRVGHRQVPHVPTREERMQAYNAARPVQFANDRFPTRKDAHRYFDPPARDELPARFEDRRGF